MKKVRFIALLLLAALALGAGGCTRSVGTNVDMVLDAWQRDANHAYDLFSTYFLNANPSDPYLD